jgi:hypothetical protein
MKNILLIAIALLSLALQSCQQKITYINVNPALKAAFNYKVGTYWIYQDSLSGEWDSFFVQDNFDTYASNYLPTTDNPQIQTEIIGIVVLENNISTITSASTSQWDFNYRANEMDLNYFGNVYDNLILYSPFINYPYDSTLTYTGYGVGGYITDSGKVINTSNQFIVGGQSYENMIEVGHHGNTIVNAVDYIYNDTFFVAPGAGIIKMILHRPLDTLHSYRVWELQRYKIVK